MNKTASCTMRTMSNTAQLLANMLEPGAKLSWNLHCAAPNDDVVPLGHLAHTTDPAVGAKVPAAQGMHANADEPPVTFENEPRGHRVQLADPLVAYVPCPQV
jgi:hypothetical protein